MTHSASWRLVAIATVVTVLAGGLAAGQARADNDTARIVAGLAVGALVYLALDDDHHPKHCAPPPVVVYRPTYSYGPPPRWSPPGHSYKQGYREGYHDGRSDDRHDDHAHYGPPPRIVYRDRHR